jgi:hypothetical protein
MILQPADGKISGADGGDSDVNSVDPSFGSSSRVRFSRLPEISNVPYGSLEPYRKLFECLAQP